MHLKSPRLLLTVLLLSLSLAAFAKDSRMLPTDPPGAAPADAAVVVFMRPSSYGAAIKSSVYDVTDGKQEFIGIVSHKDKVAYRVAPGKHLFMVVAENGDFLDADLQAGKTYYAVVSPRMGVWKARFSLLPVHTDPTAEFNTSTVEFAKWMEKTNWVKRGPAADAWYAEHQADVAKKREKYLRNWNARSDADKASLRLLPADGS